MSTPIVVITPEPPPVVLVTPPEPAAVVMVAPPGPEGPPGPPGANGVDGAQGPPGPPGGQSFIFTQAVASASWAITHGMGTKPAVTVIDTANREVFGDVNYLDDNNLTIDFGTAFSGTAYLI